MRAVTLCVALVVAAGCKKAEPTAAESGGEAKPVVTAPKPKEEPAAKVEPKKDPVKPPVAKKDDSPKKSQYDVPTAGDISLTQPANLWGLPDQNRAVLKDRFFGKRWNIKPDGNITVETDCVLSETHPYTEWLTVKVTFRDPKDLLTFKTNAKVNGYCVDAFTFVGCVYVK